MKASTGAETTACSVLVLGNTIGHVMEDVLDGVRTRSYKVRGQKADVSFVHSARGDRKYDVLVTTNFEHTITTRFDVLVTLDECQLCWKASLARNGVRDRNRHGLRRLDTSLWAHLASDLDQVFVSCPRQSHTMGDGVSRCIDTCVELLTTRDVIKQ